MNEEIIIFPQGTISNEDILECINILKEGEAVNTRIAQDELPMAEVIALRCDGSSIVAVGAIKQPRPDYANKISKRSNFPLDKNTSELGYVAVKASHQRLGIACKITNKLLSEFKSRQIFSTTSSNAMKAILKNAGFVQRGREWKGSTGNQLSLWIKDCG